VHTYEMFASVNDSLHIFYKYNDSSAFTNSFTNYAPNTKDIKQQVNEKTLFSTRFVICYSSEYLIV